MSLSRSYVTASGRDLANRSQRPARQNPLDILRDNVSFQVHFITWLQVRKVRHFPRFRNHRNLEIVVSQIGDREADAFDGD